MGDYRKMTVVLVGAGGKMGCRITDNLRSSEYEMRFVETGLIGLEQLAARSLRAVPQNDAVKGADMVILAVPDVAIKQVSQEIVPLMNSGAMLILLDPAAAYIGQLPERGDIGYFVAHPCHPPIFNDETEPEAKRDFFGGVAAKQAVVCTLVQGSEEDYGRAEELAKRMYAPVMRSHRVTLEQMAMLEPAMAETIGAAAALMLRAAMDEAIRSGVPEEAAKDFMLGHLNILLAVAFGIAGNPMSDACLIAAEYGEKRLFQEGWQRLFEPEDVRKQINLMLHP